MALHDGRSTHNTFAPGLTWSNPDSNLWVAALNDEYAGMVEFVDGHFSVRNSTGAVVAACSSIPHAKDALAQHIEAPAAVAPSRVSVIASRPRFGRVPRPVYLRETLAA